MRDNMDYLDAGGWTMKDAVMWVEKHRQKGMSGSIKKSETKQEFHCIYISDEHVGHKLQQVMVSENLGIKAVACSDCKATAVYLFICEKVYSLKYLESMIKFKEEKLRHSANQKYINNYKHTILCLKNAIKKRRGN